MKSKLVLYAFAAICMLFGGSVFGQSYAVTNARIVTVSGATIERGTVVVRDGLIEAVGANAKIPADAQVYDVNGSTVYPGFIDALSNLGLAPRPTPTPGQGGFGGGQNAQVWRVRYAEPSHRMVLRAVWHGVGGSQGVY